MQQIIYSSDAVIPWDAQSAFKITNYYTDVEDRMVFCYLRQYVHCGDLKLCTYCFDSEATGLQDLEIAINLNPTKTNSYIHFRFGIDGFDRVEFIEPDNKNKKLSCNYVCHRDMFTLHTFKANDQQGYYWCGELTIPKQAIKTIFNTELSEKSIIKLNFYKIFKGVADHASLFPDRENNKDNKSAYMQEFVVLDY